MGITMAELQAKAAQLEGAGLLMLDRMVSVRENGRRMLRKEAERRSLRRDADQDEKVVRAYRWLRKSRSLPTAPTRKRVQARRRRLDN